MTTTIRRVGHRSTYSLPDGYKAVAKPPCLFVQADLKERQTFVYMCWSTGWEMGQILNIKKQKTQNCNVIWDDGVRGSMLSLDHYYDTTSGKDGEVGEWLYMYRA